MLSTLASTGNKLENKTDNPCLHGISILGEETGNKPDAISGLVSKPRGWIEAREDQRLKPIRYVISEEIRVWGKVITIQNVMEVSLHRPQISRTWDGRNGKGEG